MSSINFKKVIVAGEPTIIMNAAGCKCTTWKELAALDRSNSSATVTKSATLVDRQGNPHPRYFEFPEGTINSNGLCNNGFEYYLEYAKLRRWTKPLIISIGGDLTGIKKMLERSLFKCPKNTFFEVNLSCPNIKAGQPPFDILLKNLLYYVDKLGVKIGLKMPVIFDLREIDRLSSIINTYRCVIWYISCSNSLPNGLILDADFQPVILGGKNGLGGIGGEYLKPFSLMNVREFSRLLVVDVIGCGGVQSVKDVQDYIHCGAVAVQVGSHLMKNSPNYIDDWIDS